MGNLNSNKTCCCVQADHDSQFHSQIKTKFDQNNPQIKPITPKSQQSHNSQNSPIVEQEIISEKENNNNKDLQIHLNQLKILQPKYFQIYLTPDQSWVRGLYNNLIDIDEAYKQISNIKSQDDFWQKKIVKRSAYDNKKIQLLFKQNIPTIGKYFFEADLIQYLPNKKCDFTIGVVNYHFAREQIHVRDSSEEHSHTFIQRKINIDQKDLNKSVQLNLKFRVQITREDLPQIAIFVNEKLQKRQTLKKSLQSEVISLVPYIQTQYQGIVFGWKSSLKRSISSYRISTIFQEPSSIISV